MPINLLDKLQIASGRWTITMSIKLESENQHKLLMIEKISIWIPRRSPSMIWQRRTIKAT